MNHRNLWLGVFGTALLGALAAPACSSDSSNPGSGGNAAAGDTSDGGGVGGKAQGGATTAGKSGTAGSHTTAGAGGSSAGSAGKGGAGAQGGASQAGAGGDDLTGGVGTGGAPEVAIEHVLLLSVDGMHQKDLDNWVSTHPASALAGLTKSGVVFSKASSSKPSDSFPGLIAQITGGSPKTTGVYYDVSYARDLYPPGSACVGNPGTQVVYDESLDTNPDALDGGGSLSEAGMPLDKTNGCKPVYPHNFLRVNTIFGVLHGAGMYTAWSDKHLAYELVSGPGSATGHENVDDLYTPEINSIDAVTTKDFTKNIDSVIRYDELKVKAVLHEIDGKSHDGVTTKPVPALFGMNFQAVSVGQKLFGLGYTDAAGTPTAALAGAIDHVDSAVGRMVAELKAQGLYDSTVIVLSAKHGQSPIDPAKLTLIKDDAIDNVIGVEVGSEVADDFGIFWLTDSSNTAAAVTKLNADLAGANTVNAQTIYSGDALKTLFADPATDARVPNFLVQPKVGTVYVGNVATKPKQAEHGGFTEDDTHVLLVVSGGQVSAKVTDTAVTTQQIAPTILKLLGQDPQKLDAVKAEGTAALPGF